MTRPLGKTELAGNKLTLQETIDALAQVRSDISDTLDRLLAMVKRFTGVELEFNYALLVRADSHGPVGHCFHGAFSAEPEQTTAFLKAWIAELEDGKSTTQVPAAENFHD